MANKFWKSGTTFAASSLRKMAYTADEKALLLTANPAMFCMPLYDEVLGRNDSDPLSAFVLKDRSLNNHHMVPFGVAKPLWRGLNRSSLLLFGYGPGLANGDGGRNGALKLQVPSDVFSAAYTLAFVSRVPTPSVADGAFGTPAGTGGTIIGAASSTPVWINFSTSTGRLDWRNQQGTASAIAVAQDFRNSIPYGFIGFYSGTTLTILIYDPTTATWSTFGTNTSYSTGVPTAAHSREPRFGNWGADWAGDPAARTDTLDRFIGGLGLFYAQTSVLSGALLTNLQNVVKMQADRLYSM